MAYVAFPYSNTALSNTKQEVRDNPSGLCGYNIYNPNSSVTYIQFFDLDADNVTVGTTVPTFTLALPATGGVDAPPASTSLLFSKGVTISATTTPTGSTAPSTAVVCTLFVDTKE